MLLEVYHPTSSLIGWIINLDFEHSLPCKRLFARLHPMMVIVRVAPSNTMKSCMDCVFLFPNIKMHCMLHVQTEHSGRWFAFIDTRGGGEEYNH